MRTEDALKRSMEALKKMKESLPEEQVKAVDEQVRMLTNDPTFSFIKIIEDAETQVESQIKS